MLFYGQHRKLGMGFRMGGTGVNGLTINEALLLEREKDTGKEGMITGYLNITRNISCTYNMGKR